VVSSASKSLLFRLLLEPKLGISKLLGLFWSLTSGEKMASSTDSKEGIGGSLGLEGLEIVSSTESHEDIDTVS
jgi:hypothetical protein